MEFWWDLESQKEKSSKSASRRPWIRRLRTIQPRTRQLWWQQPDQVWLSLPWSETMVPAPTQLNSRPSNLEWWPTIYPGGQRIQNLSQSQGGWVMLNSGPLTFTPSNAVAMRDFCRDLAMFSTLARAVKLTCIVASDMASSQDSSGSDSVGSFVLITTRPTRQTQVTEWSSLEASTLVTPYLVYSCSSPWSFSLLCGVLPSISLQSMSVSFLPRPYQHSHKWPTSRHSWSKQVITTHWPLIPTLLSSPQLKRNLGGILFGEFYVTFIKNEENSKIQKMSSFYPFNF